MHRQAARDGFVDVRRHDISRQTLEDHLRRIGWARHLSCIWVPDPKKLSHTVSCRAALASLGALRTKPAAVELLLPSTRWVRPRDGLCPHYASGFDGVRALQQHGMALAHVPRALADAVRLRHRTLGQVGKEIDARQHFPGGGKLRRAHEELTGELNHSGYERLGRRLLREADEQAPSRPMPVIHNDRPVAEVDLPFHDLRHGIEIDGPPHLLPEVAAEDRARDRMLARVCNWEIDRYLWFKLEEEPERFVREVTARLRQLRGSG